MRQTINGGGAWVIVALCGVGGCGFNASSVGQPIKQQAHYAEWSELERASLHFELPVISMISADLVDGERANPADPGQEEVAASLAFLRFAESEEEVAEALTRAAVGCGRCHAARSIKPPHEARWSHSTGFSDALSVLIWPRPARSGPGSTEAWAEPSSGPPDPPWVKAQLLRCVACHRSR